MSGPFSGLQKVKVCAEVCSAMIRAGYAGALQKKIKIPVCPLRPLFSFTQPFEWLLQSRVIHPKANAWQRLNLASHRLA